MIDTNKKYEGYLWLSDQDQPIVIENEDLTNYAVYLEEGHNPFVVEGQLYCKDERISYRIKHTGSKVRVYKHSLDAQDGKVLEDVIYASHRMGNRKLHFYRVWAPQKDRYCCDMEVLTIENLIFIGFNY